MKHKMRLHDEEYEKIKKGNKTIEMRINDEKRQLLKIKDLIEFTNRKTNEKMLVVVKNLYFYTSFEELYKHHDKISLGYKEDETVNFKELEKYYTKEEESKYGVVAIEIRKL